MTNNPTPKTAFAVTAQSIHVTVSGQPDIENKFGPGRIRPDSVRLSYRGQHIDARVDGFWVRENGELTTERLDQRYAVRDATDIVQWPDWLCALATLLRPAAVPSAPADRCPHGCDVSTCPCLACEADQAALRDRIAEALRPGSRDRSGQYPEGLLRDVDAVLAVLPADVEQAALRPLSPYYEHPACGFHWHGRDGMDIPMQDGEPVCPRCELRRLTDASAPAASLSDDLLAAQLAPLEADARDGRAQQHAAVRAAALTEAADFLRDAHFGEGLSVQEIGTALRHWADRERADAASGPGGVAGETRQPETQAERPLVKLGWGDIIPAPVDEAAQERDQLITRINRVRAALNDCKARGATGMQYEIAVAIALGDREATRHPGPLCHQSDPVTLRECALRAAHEGDHRDGDLAWPAAVSQPDGEA